MRVIYLCHTPLFFSPLFLLSFSLPPPLPPPKPLAGTVKREDSAVAQQCFRTVGFAKNRMHAFRMEDSFLSLPPPSPPLSCLSPYPPRCSCRGRTQMIQRPLNDERASPIAANPPFLSLLPFLPFPPRFPLRRCADNFRLEVTLTCMRN